MPDEFQPHSEAARAEWSMAWGTYAHHPAHASHDAKVLRLAFGSRSLCYDGRLKFLSRSGDDEYFTVSRCS